MNQRKINLWDNVQIMGNLIVSGTTYITSLSGVYFTSVFGLSNANSLAYNASPYVNIDNTRPNNPQLTFGIPIGQPALNPVFSIGNVQSSSSPYVTLSWKLSLSRFFIWYTNP